MVSLAQDLERGLVEAGVSDEEAKRIALGLDERISAMATKEDLFEVRDSLRRELDLILSTMEERFRAQDEMQAERLQAMDQMHKQRMDAQDELWNERILAHDQRIGERFNLVDSHFALIEQRFGVMEERANLADQRLNSIDNRLSDHDARFDELIARFDMLERTMWRVFMLMFGFLTAVFGGLMYAAFG